MRARWRLSAAFRRTIARDIFWKNLPTLLDGELRPFVAAAHSLNIP